MTQTVKNEVTIVLPTLSKLLGLDKFQLTYSQKCDCISLYNHAGETAMINQAKKFQDKNKTIKPNT